MKKFLALYMGFASAIEEWGKLDQDKRTQREKAGKEAWMKWAMANKKSIVDDGSPLGKTKLISARGISNTKNEIAAYTIVQAESHEAAAKMFENHPHFKIFPGHSVEIMECLPMPGM